MAYQKCPICRGTGKEQVVGITITYQECTTCRGAKIINEDTGLPPSTSGVFGVDEAQDEVNRILNLNKE